jgi:ribonuclease Z
MRPLFHPRLINGPFEDPALLISFDFERRAILFDLGEIYPLSARDVLKISHIFVTHTHIDHFAGFDRLLRICLGREKDLHLYGPAGFLSNVEGKLAGYTWNLVEQYGDSFSIRATEIHPDHRLTRFLQG